MDEGRQRDVNDMSLCYDYFRYAACDSITGRLAVGETEAAVPGGSKDCQWQRYLITSMFHPQLHQLSDTDTEHSAEVTLSRNVTSSRTMEGFLLPASVAACLLYGLLLIVLIHTPADGSWFWYARSLRQGTHLYRDLHLALQPLYTVELAFFQRCLGVSWLASQIPACFNLLLFVASLALVSRFIPLPSAWKALLCVCAFVVAMGFVMMRFDDYHVLSASFELLCAALLLYWEQAENAGTRLTVLAAVGVLCGLCVMNRLNDGGLLTMACFTVIAGTAFSRSKAGGSAKFLHLLKELLVPAIAIAGTVFGVLRLLHETFADWTFYSITRAAAIKGGTGHVFLYPLHLPLGTLREFASGRWRSAAVFLYIVTLALLSLYGAHRARDADGKIQRRKIIAGLVAVVLVLSLPFHAHITHGNVGRLLVAALVLCMYAAAAIVIYNTWKYRRGEAELPARQLILLLPLSQLVSISMSAARWYPNTYPPAAVFLLLLPIGMPGWFAHRQQRVVWFTLLSLLTVSVGIDKIRNPFDWFNYRARSFDAPRTWTHHPLYGSMLIQNDQLQLMAPVCREVGSSTELLSVPFTFANYFCGLPPWHGYVQTFFDTASRQTLEALTADLERNPPEWILYQRQLEVLAENERAFNGGNPLPHRALEAYIMQHVENGTWSAVREQAPFRDTSTWLLIHTRPGSRTEPSTIAKPGL